MNFIKTPLQSITQTTGSSCMIVESMNDQEFVLEVMRDYFNEMRDYAIRALIKKGKIKKRHSSNYSSKRGNNWFIVYSPEAGGHVGVRLSERYHPGLTPSEALKEMLMKTPAINQAEVEDTFYTRVNGGVCLGSVYGKRMTISVGNYRLQVDLRKTNTFISDDGLFDDQKKVTEESIARAIEKLGKNYLTDEDRDDASK
jgi:hypothetical protein